MCHCPFPTVIAHSKSRKQSHAVHRSVHTCTPKSNRTYFCTPRSFLSCTSCLWGHGQYRNACINSGSPSSRGQGCNRSKDTCSLSLCNEGVCWGGSGNCVIWKYGHRSISWQDRSSCNPRLSSSSKKGAIASAHFLSFAVSFTQTPIRSSIFRSLADSRLYLCNPGTLGCALHFGYPNLFFPFLCRF